MDELLIWLLLFASLAWMLARRRRAVQSSHPGSERDGGEMRSALQRYQRLDGALLGAPMSLAGIPARSWEPLALEAVPQPSRRRLVLSISVKDEALERERLERLLWALAGRLQEATAAHAVVVEAFAETESAPRAGGGLLRLVLSPDGRGWSGEEGLVAALEGSDAAAVPLELGEVHRQLHATLDANRPGR